MRVNVFFYGLFMDVELLLSKGVVPQNPILAQLRRYSIRIGNRATLIPKANKSVYGVLMSLTQQEIDLLYADESLKEYRPEPIMVYTKDKRMLPALCFNLVKPPAAHERNEEYARKLKLVAIRWHLPEDYVNSIC
jgi:hypothetical protein